MSGLFWILGILLLMFLTWFCIILFHELAHAAVILTIAKGDVNIFVGSFGNSKQSLKVQTGRLTTFIKYNPLRWTKGRCVLPKEPISYNHLILCIAAGPLVSVLTGLLALLIYQNINPGILRFELLLFGFTSVAIGLGNLFPRTHKKQDDGVEVIHTSDGATLIKLFRIKFLPAEYGLAFTHFNNKQYAEAAIEIQKLIDTGNKNKYVLRLAINSNILAKNFMQGDKLAAFFLKKYLCNATDFCNAGYLKSMLKEPEAALVLFKKSLALDSGSAYVLNNIGNALLVLKRYPEAKEYLDAGISVSPKLAHLYSNLGLVKMHLNDLEGSLRDIHHSLELDPNFADGYSSLGQYHMNQKEWSEAKLSLQKAKELDPDDADIDRYLIELEEALQNKIGK